MNHRLEKFESALNMDVQAVKEPLWNNRLSLDSSTSSSKISRSVTFDLPKLERSESEVESELAGLPRSYSDGHIHISRIVNAGILMAGNIWSRVSGKAEDAATSGTTTPVFFADEEEEYQFLNDKYSELSKTRAEMDNLKSLLQVTEASRASADLVQKAKVSALSEDFTRNQENLKQELAISRELRKSLKTSVEEHKKTKGACEVLHFDMEELKSKLESAKNDREIYQSKYRHLKSEFETYKMEKGKLEKKASDLELNTSKLSEELSDVQKTLQEKDAELDDYQLKLYAAEQEKDAAIETAKGTQQTLRKTCEEQVSKLKEDKVKHKRQLTLVESQLQEQKQCRTDVEEDYRVLKERFSKAEVEIGKMKAIQTEAAKREATLKTELADKILELEKRNKETETFKRETKASCHNLENLLGSTQASLNAAEEKVIEQSKALGQFKSGMESMKRELVNIGKLKTETEAHLFAREKEIQDKLHEAQRINKQLQKHVESLAKSNGVLQEVKNDLEDEKKTTATQLNALKVTISTTNNDFNLLKLKYDESISSFDGFKSSSFDAIASKEHDVNLLKKSLTEKEREHARFASQTKAELRQSKEREDETCRGLEILRVELSIKTKQIAGLQKLVESKDADLKMSFSTAQTADRQLKNCDTALDEAKSHLKQYSHEIKRLKTENKKSVDSMDQYQGSCRDFEQKWKHLLEARLKELESARNESEVLQGFKRGVEKRIEIALNAWHANKLNVFELAISAESSVHFDDSVDVLGKLDEVFHLLTSSEPGWDSTTAFPLSQMERCGSQIDATAAFPTIAARRGSAASASSSYQMTSKIVQYQELCAFKEQEAKRLTDRVGNLEKNLKLAVSQQFVSRRLSEPVGAKGMVIGLGKK